MLRLVRRRVKKLFSRRYNYEGDVFAVRKVNTGFLNDGAFQKSWDVAKAGNSKLWPNGVPDVRWRAHVALWAATRGLDLKGDFVECGVYGGLLSLTICEHLGFKKDGPRFWLFDTFHGLPLAQLPADEIESATKANRLYKTDVYEIAKQNFAPYPNVKLIKGALPGSLSQAPELKKISYLSMDLNSASAEQETIDALWDSIVLGATIVLDDYGFKGHTQQYEMWNRFARSKNRTVMTIPTGQGLFIK